MLNKRILGVLLLLLVSLFQFVTPSAQGKSSELILEDIAFFESGRDVPKESQRHYSTYFAKSTSRFIMTQVDFRNLLYNRNKQTHEVTLQYYGSTGNLLGETKKSAIIKPEWEHCGYCNGIGWEQKGEWSEGKYTVHVLIDGEKMGRAGFSILNDDDYGQRTLLGDINPDLLLSALFGEEEGEENIGEKISVPFSFFLKIAQGQRTLYVRDMDEITIRKEPFAFVFPIREYYDHPKAKYDVRFAGSKERAILRKCRSNIKITECFSPGSGLAGSTKPYDTFWFTDAESRGHHYIIFQEEGTQRADLVDYLPLDGYEVSWTVRSFNEIPITKLRDRIFIVAASDVDLDGVIDKNELIHFTLKLQE
jgi:hypothetical protein